ncbi:hypothetical protein B0T10DRAFT_464547 [Thelonectria olida]|uniref:Uncharacterized protein n=1 Tax=Thelonectria olida TaxID=1576542 RepID=A0A9P8VVG5_9HYPO|nr:hypothetical protein B0T10DRAFT_464547 [Thelonectria olida]
MRSRVHLDSSSRRGPHSDTTKLGNTTLKPSPPPVSSVVAQTWDVLSLAHLITESNIKADVQPVVIFAMLSVASGRVTTNANPTWEQVSVAFPHSGLYIWLYVLHFDCSNQKDPASIEEDRLNKPWRAIPSGRLTIQGAERCGASSWWGKNLINALFYLTGQLGSTRVAARFMGSASITKEGYIWCGLLGLNTFSTVQIQDLRDQEGDKARGRRTVPIAMGDIATRWVTSMLILFWSVACPTYWADSTVTAGHMLPLLIGTIVAFRVFELQVSQG